MINSIKPGRRRWPGLLWMLVAVVSLLAVAVQLAWSPTATAAAGAASGGGGFSGAGEHASEDPPTVLAILF